MSETSKLVLRKNGEGLAIALRWDKVASTLAREVEELESELAEARVLARRLKDLMRELLKSSDGLGDVLDGYDPEFIDPIFDVLDRMRKETDDARWYFRE